jgi:hypothetical protein
MAEEKHHHHLFHHKKDEAAGEYGGGATEYSETVVTEGVSTGGDEYGKYKKEEKEHKHKQHLGEAGAIAAGAFALVRDRDHACLINLSFFVHRTQPIN